MSCSLFSRFFMDFAFKNKAIFSIISRLLLLYRDGTEINRFCKWSKKKTIMSEFNACISNSVTLYTCNLQSMSGLQRPVSDDNNDRQSLELSRVVTILFCNIVLK